MMNKRIISDEIYIIDNFLTEEACDVLIEFSEDRGYEEAKVNLDGKQVLMTTVRNNERILDMDNQRAERYWSKLESFHPSELGNSIAIGLNELFRFYKYTPKQRFKKHRDGRFERNEREFSAYTFMIYLNDNFTGGETEFGEVIIHPKKGSALIFRHELKHEGKTVTDGVKYVLRSDIMYRLKMENE